VEVKLAGGGDFLDDNQIFRIGERNIEAVLAVLGRNGVQLNAQDTGGHCSRTMSLELATGKVMIKTPVNPF
jgi:chemotaxis protein CheD